MTARTRETACLIGLIDLSPPGRDKKKRPNTLHYTPKHGTADANLLSTLNPPKPRATETDTIKPAHLVASRLTTQPTCTLGLGIPILSRPWLRWTLSAPISLLSPLSPLSHPPRQDTADGQSEAARPMRKTGWHAALRTADSSWRSAAPPWPGS